MLQILVATDDGDIVSSCQIRSVFVVSSSELVSDIIKVRLFLRRVAAAWRCPVLTPVLS